MFGTRGAKAKNSGSEPSDRRAVGIRANNRALNDNSSPGISQTQEIGALATNQEDAVAVRMQRLSRFLYLNRQEKIGKEGQSFIKNDQQRLLGFLDATASGHKANGEMILKRQSIHGATGLASLKHPPKDPYAADEIPQKRQDEAASRVKHFRKILRPHLREEDGEEDTEAHSNKSPSTGLTRPDDQNLPRDEEENERQEEESKVLLSLDADFLWSSLTFIRNPPTHQACTLCSAHFTSSTPTERAAWRLLTCGHFMHDTCFIRFANGEMGIITIQKQRDGRSCHICKAFWVKFSELEDEEKIARVRRLEYSLLPWKEAFYRRSEVQRGLNSWPIRLHP